ncbi:hypothetical protein TrRE_jg13453 [Triparma retinervis]|uniref:Semialdehyde dehydrogenase NAD-binding domain-containing protein n=1 Tax=Triparma retinervis TaxID=2557542 RepID=A0A9W7ANR1_9STRA|nr:hypothetical protein TrRE_jg13453 [Triparma retinervis]
MNPVPVALLGGTGLSGRVLYSILSSHPTFKCVSIIGSSASEDRRFEEVWEEKEKKLEEIHQNVGYERLPFPSNSDAGCVRPMTFETFLSSHTPTSVKFVFSTISPSLGFLETRLTSIGFTVVSISPHGRLPSNTFVIEHSLSSLPLAPASLYKSPNCVVCGLTPVLSCLVSNLRPLGLEVSGLTITTMQSLTGRGDSPYDTELCVGNMLPVGQIEDTEQYITSELNGLFGFSSSMSVDVRCYRGGAARCHLIDLRVLVGGLFVEDIHVQTDDVKKWCEEYDPCKEYYDLARTVGVHTTKAENTPIHFSSNKTGMLQSSVKGMTVVVTNLAVEKKMIKMTVMVDNLMKGAAGAQEAKNQDPTPSVP